MGKARENIPKITMTINPRTESQFYNVVNATMLSGFFRPIIRCFANATISEGEVGKFTEEAILVCCRMTKF